MPAEKRKDRFWTTPAALLLLAALALAVPLSREARAEPTTRSDYVARLETICKPGVEATQKAMKGVRDDIRAERDGIAAGKFRRGTRIFGGTLGRIAKVPRPPADTPKLKKWFTYLNRQETYLKAITTNLRAGQATRAQRSTARFIHNGNLANNVVLAFGFNYCSFKFSRFG